jgi:hypothetical protein
MTERIHSEELNRIDAAIRQRNQAELQWVHDYCQAQMRSARPNEEKGRWMRRQREVGGVLRELQATEDHISAHEWSSYHRETLKESNVCGCFYCLGFFLPSEIQIWTDDDETALCPKCGIDSVIGSVSGYPIEREFIKKMHDYWF